MGKPIRAYVHPNRSRLEKWRDEITTMRELEWPNNQIAKWLYEEKQIKVSGEAVRKFCRTRKIVKGQIYRTPSPRKVAHERKPISSKKRVFEYDDTKPIEIKH